MRDLSRFETVSPLAVLGAQPGLRPRGPVRWSFDDRPARERPTLLRECFERVGGHYDFHALPDAPFHVDLAIHGLPGLVMMAGSLYGSRSRGARELAAETGDDAALTVGLKGSHHVEQRNRAIVLGEGEAAFTSCTDRSIVRHSGRSEILVVRFPKARFAPLVDGPDDRMVRRIPSELPALRLLRSYLTAAWDEQADAGPDVQRSLVTHVYELMAAMMGATRDAAALAQERGVAAARLYAIKGDIARNLAWSGLTVAALALRHRCTARSIQRLFEQEGTTFTEYLVAQRLARAHELLGDPRRRAEKISTVALDCGFGDISYFNRVFRRRYGAAPSDVRAQARDEVVTSGRRDN
jgi:AraC-like DNA-binding protein